MQHLGLLGGTFDPIHQGHLHLVSTVLKQLSLDELRLIPCYQTVHRDQPIATPKQRLIMTRLACEDASHLICDDTEYQRGGLSYMIDTLETIRQHKPNARLYLIIGYDAFTQFKTWKNWQGILSLAHLIVAKRPPYQDENNVTVELMAQHGSDINTLKSHEYGKICVLEIDALDISSTLIRRALQANQDVSSLLPKKVYEFIEQEGLYAH